MFQLGLFILQEDLLCVWNRTATDTASTARIRDTLRRILNLPPNTPMEYNTHCDCLKYIKTAVPPIIPASSTTTAVPAAVTAASSS